MEKLLILFCASFLIVQTGSATPSSKTMEEQVDVQIQKSNQEVAKNRPHAPARRFFSAFLDTESSILFVNSLSDVGEVFAVIENIDAGEIFQYVFDSSKTASLPLSCTCGEWSITLILNGGGEYIGHFYL